MQAINDILGSELEIGAELTEAQMELLSGGRGGCGGRSGRGRRGGFSGCGAKGKSRGKGSSCGSSKSSSVGCKPPVTLPPDVPAGPTE